MSLSTPPSSPTLTPGSLSPASQSSTTTSFITSTPSSPTSQPSISTTTSHSSSDSNPDSTPSSPSLQPRSSSCLQCHLLNLPCTLTKLTKSKPKPSCSRCLRNNEGFCIQQATEEGTYSAVGVENEVVLRRVEELDEAKVDVWVFAPRGKVDLVGLRKRLIQWMLVVEESERSI